MDGSSVSSTTTGCGCRGSRTGRLPPSFSAIVRDGTRVADSEKTDEVAMWSLPPTDTVLHLLTYVALTAVAMTAALAAGRRSMDWVGVCMLGCITALGGGTIRDVLLGHYPLPWVQNPSYLALTAGAAFATILRGASAERRVSRPRRDRPRGIHGGRLRRRVAGQCI